MTRLSSSLLSMLMSTAVAYAVPAYAQDFTVTETFDPANCMAGSCTTGIVTLNNNVSSDGVFYVDELFVAVPTISAATTVPSWNASTVFSGTSTCLTSSGFSFPYGACYQETAAGSAIGPGMSSSGFSFSATFVDPTTPESFFVAFTDGAGASFACLGTVGGGCDAPVAVPEPAPMGLFVVSLIGLATILRRRQA